jgi:hypothetical protein
MSNIGFPVAGPTNTASYQPFQDNHVLVTGSANIDDNESEYSYPGGDSTDDSNQDAQIDNDEVRPTAVIIGYPSHPYQWLF